MRVQHLLESVQYLSVDLSNHQQIAILNDQNIPKGKFFDSMLVMLHLFDFLSNLDSPIQMFDRKKDFKKLFFNKLWV